MIGKDLGNYRILEMIGKGGMAVVYKGRHKTLSRRIVAIKMLSANLEGDASFSERFFREAEVMDRLRHPNIVTLYDFIEEEGHFFIVMEYVAGKTLSEIIKEAGGPLSHHEIMAVFQQVLAGIGYAHSLGIVHRDLKPGNIMINEEGEVKVTDFGIARLLGNNFESTLTTTGLGIGSPYYMSPEQVLASKDHPITGASDIYSLGITLYQMVTGKLPFEEADSLFTIMQSHLKKPPPPPREIIPGIPVPLEDVILKSIQKKPEDRWPSCEAFWEFLAGALVDPARAGRATETMRTAPFEIQPPEVKPEEEPRKKSYRAALLVIFGLAVVLLGGVGGFFLLRHQPTPPALSTGEAQKPISKAVQKPIVVAKSETASSPAKRRTVDSADIADEKKEKKGEITKPARTLEKPEKATTEEDRKRALQAAQEKVKREKEQNEIKQLLNQASVFLSLKEYSKAQDAALKVLKREPGNGKAKEISAQAKERKRRMTADNEIAQAQTHFEAKKYRLAAKETAAVLKMYPRDPQALELKGKLEELARRALEKKQKIEAALKQAEEALEGKRFIRAKLIAQQVLDVEPENKRAKRVIEMADEGQQNKLLQDVVKGFLPSVGGGEMPASSQGVQNQSGGGEIPSLPLPGLSGQ